MMYYCEECKQYWKSATACFEWKYVKIEEIPHEKCPRCDKPKEKMKNAR